MVRVLLEVPHPPAIKGAIAHALAGMEQPQRAHCTGLDVGRGVAGLGPHLLRNLVAPRDDTIPGGHAALLAWAGRPSPAQRRRVDSLLHVRPRAPSVRPVLPPWLASHPPASTAWSTCCVGGRIRHVLE